MPGSTVSVVIPTRNREQTLAIALDSILRQTAPGWDCWVIDDHSTDGTKALLERYCGMDARFHYAAMPETAHGANAARNAGVRLSAGKYLVFLDSDDALKADCLQNRLEHLAANPQLDFSVRGTWLFRDCPGDVNLVWNVPADAPDLHRFLTLDIPWQTAGVVWQREKLIALGGWDETLLSWQDWELHLRALAAGLTYDINREPDCYWRLPRNDSLWKLSYQPVHFRQKGRLFGHIQRSLRGTWNAQLQQLLAGLYFWQACLWRDHRGTAWQSIRLWTLARVRGLIPWSHFLSGCLLFFLGKPGRQERIKRLRRTWPEYYFRTGTSATFQKIPGS